MNPVDTIKLIRWEYC